MTYTQMQAERRSTALKKLIDAAQAPLTFEELGAATGYSKAHVRVVMRENMQNFSYVGMQAGGTANSKLWIAKEYQDNINVISDDTQAIYRNPYSQLMNEPDLIPRQFGKVTPCSIVHNLRDCRKSAHTYVSGSTLA
jgi:hypothetical protein